ncbi:TetR/AcrR family transcriptional regulator [Flexibacterium corallicola]|uniref:TetR/AcrR family transcriptional regulator n=1 Tax=Flexibacterium corallicola TaxID=3037259 RepID=UPI00286F85DC|nr:TetR/AcrR family transcriptional regulator [Pseudovibrio sp. M1P-2-3]
MTSRGRPRKFDRDAALKSAMVLFWEQGYETTSMSDLVSSMGINSPSIYAAFGSKEALFLEALKLYCQTDGARVWDAMTQEISAFKAVEAMLITSAREYTRSDRPHGCFVILEALHGHAGNESIRQELCTLRSANIRRLAQYLDHSMSDKEQAPDLDWQAIARFIVTLQQGMSIQARDGETIENLLEVAKQGTKCFEYLVGIQTT